MAQNAQKQPLDALGADNGTHPHPFPSDNALVTILSDESINQSHCWYRTKLIAENFEDKVRIIKEYEGCINDDKGGTYTPYSQTVIEIDNTALMMLYRNIRWNNLRSLVDEMDSVANMITEELENCNTCHYEDGKMQYFMAEVNDKVSEFQSEKGWI